MGPDGSRWFTKRAGVWPVRNTKTVKTVKTEQNSVRHVPNL